MKRNRLVMFLAVLGITWSSVAYGQGLFQTENGQSLDATTSSSGDELRAGGKPSDPGDLAPIGEGIAILSVLAVGYGVARKRKQNA
ncbi:MAG: hypothetical protein LBN93_08055 [Candidatus Symbiothrix sp.]|jgi:hypothetical protein|nr:hypothetical protein [Candidatus Symbiothrix sp.]